MKKHVLIISIMAILSFIAFSCKKTKAVPKSVNAIITSITGNVTLNGKTAKKDMVVKAGDTIETAQASSCQFLIKDKNIFIIKANSKLEYNISETANDLKLVKGWFAGVTKEKFTKSGMFTISTPTAVAGIRGTSMCIKVENERSSYMCVCNGVINLKGSSETTGENVEAAHHKAKRFKLNQAGTLSVEDAPMLYHNDDTLNSLAKKIGITINWENSH